ncbi:MAG TPA: hypothetical protein VNI01_14325, partial [Elusimicrobiota bacterium]|nr:hypothetical protein [Elusimicrobiota bacterium]
MTSADVGALAFLAIPAGIAIAAWSKLSRKSADAAAADPPRPIAELVPGAPATIEGKAWAGFTSPTGTAERVVTVEEVWVRHQDGYSDSREHYGSMVEGTHWSLSRSDCWGGFFIDDASGRALVLPNMASLKELTHQKVEAEPSLAPGAEWRKDRWIEAGDAVCVHGVPRTLREAI